MVIRYTKSALILAVSIAAGLSLAACSQQAGTRSDTNSQASSQMKADSTMHIKGQALYRERIMAPPGSYITVTLSDVSIADKAAPVLAEETIELDGRSVPVAFDLTVPKDQIKPNMRYSVRATLRGPGDRLLWTTDTANLIDPAAAQNDMGDLVMIKVPRQ